MKQAGKNKQEIFAMNKKEIKQKKHRPSERKCKLRLAETQRLFYRAEKILGGQLITYWNTANGIIAQDDAEAFRSLLSDAPVADNLFLCLTSTGGNGMATVRIANLLRRRCKRLIVLVPACAESAATMLALAADEIHLAPHANLGPVDTAIQHALAPVNQTNDQVNVGQDELARIMALWRKETHSRTSNPYAELWHYIHPLVIGAVDRANSLSLKLCDVLMAYHMDDKILRRKIATMLTTAYPAHGYPILLSEARRIGIPANPMDPEVEKVLAALQEYYVEAGKIIRTDQDENHHHDHELTTIVERSGRMAFYRMDRDWFYRKEERRWLPMNANDRWYMAEMNKGEIKERPLHIQ
jgi:ATP-dependent protease ClpP protease subunit